MTEAVHSAHCHSCGAEPVEEASYCHRCGASLAAAGKKTVPCMVCGQPNRASAVKCPYCGTKDWSAPFWGLVFMAVCLGTAQYYSPHVEHWLLQGLVRWGVGGLGVVLALVELAWLIELFRPSLARMKKKRNVEGLAKTLRTKDASLRRAAAQALVSLGWEPADETQRRWLGLEGAEIIQPELVEGN